MGLLKGILRHCFGPVISATDFCAKDAHMGKLLGPESASYYSPDGCQGAHWCIITGLIILSRITIIDQRFLNLVTKRLLLRLVLCTLCGMLNLQFPLDLADITRITRY